MQILFSEFMKEIHVFLNIATTIYQLLLYWYNLRQEDDVWRPFEETWYGRRQHRTLENSWYPWYTVSFSSGKGRSKGTGLKPWSAVETCWKTQSIWRGRNITQWQSENQEFWMGTWKVRRRDAGTEQDKEKNQRHTDNMNFEVTISQAGSQGNQNCEWGQDKTHKNFRSKHEGTEKNTNERLQLWLSMKNLKTWMKTTSGVSLSV